MHPQWDWLQQADLDRRRGLRSGTAAGGPDPLQQDPLGDDHPGPASRPQVGRGLVGALLLAFALVVVVASVA